MRAAARKTLPADGFVVMTKEHFYEAVPPDKRDLTRCEGPCEVETGRKIGADYLVAGDIALSADGLRLTARLYDTGRGDVLESQVVSGKTVGALVHRIKLESGALFARLPGSGQQAAASRAPAPAKAEPAKIDDRKSPEAGREATPEGFVLIPPGTFWMGCEPGDPECYPGENPRHQVTLRRAYYLGKTEVTQGQWKRVMGSNPSQFSSCGDECPVEQVSWTDAIDFANRLSDQEGLTRCYRVTGSAVAWETNCAGYRLPTEAEWEHAARGGWDGETRPGPVDAVAWYDANSGGRTRPVGQKQANGYGAHDVLGNVWEWTWDRYGAYPSGTVVNPQGAGREGSCRVFRGGGWCSVARHCRTALRDCGAPGDRFNFVGLRLARWAR